MKRIIAIDDFAIDYPEDDMLKLLTDLQMMASGDDLALAALLNLEDAIGKLANYPFTAQNGSSICIK